MREYDLDVPLRAAHYKVFYSLYLGQFGSVVLIAIL